MQQRNNNKYFVYILNWRWGWHWLRWCGHGERKWHTGWIRTCCNAKVEFGEEMIKFVSIEMHLREILYLIDYCDCQVNVSFVGFSKYKLLRSNQRIREGDQVTVNWNTIQWNKATGMHTGWWYRSTWYLVIGKERSWEQGFAPELMGTGI